MPRASSPATLKTLIFETFLAASLSGTESVTTTSSMRRCANALNGRAGKHRMRAGGVHFRRAFLQQGLGRFHQRARRVNDVVDDQRGAPAHVADQVHHFADVNIHAALIHDGQRRIQFLREGARPLHAARIGRYHRQDC